MTIHLRPRQAGRDAHLVDHVLELADLQLVVFGRRSGQRAIDRNRAGGEQHRAIAGVVAGQRRHAADAERRQRCRWETRMSPFPR